MLPFNFSYQPTDILSCKRKTISSGGYAKQHSDCPAKQDYCDTIFYMLKPVPYPKYVRCDQVVVWMVQSVCLSVRLFVCQCLSVRLLHIFDNVPVMVSSWNVQEWLPLTKVMSMQKVKVRG